MNIDGLSEQTLQKFINLGWVREYSDLFHISQHAIVLRDMEGFGTKSVTNLLAATEKARQVEARRLLFALNIPLVGQDVCTRLLTAYPPEGTHPDGTQHAGRRRLCFYLGHRTGKEHIVRPLDEGLPPCGNA